MSTAIVMAPLSSPVLDLSACHKNVDSAAHMRYRSTVISVTNEWLLLVVEYRCCRNVRP